MSGGPVRLALPVAALALALAAAACGSSSDDAPPASTTSTAEPTPTSPPPTATPTPKPFQGLPARLRIPSQGVDAPVESLGLDAKGSLDSPKDKLKAVGWYPDYSKPPGTPGNVFISGFVFADGLPGPFRFLANLSPGAEVELLDGDGGMARYTVLSLTRYPKASVPFGDVLGGTGRPEGAEWLTLLTDGGEQDADRNYLSYDVVVAQRR